jgi:phage tail-like protein
MPTAADIPLGLSMRFNVTIDAYELASWSKASGLEVSWDLVEYRSGDGDNVRWICPGLTKYPTVKLERAAEEAGSKMVRTWLNSNSFKYEAQSASIELFDAGLKKVASWDLQNVMPVKWSIASFDAGTSKVALETLELAHIGFLEEEK